MKLKAKIANKILDKLGRTEKIKPSPSEIYYPPQGKDETEKQYRIRVPFQQREVKGPVELDYRGRPRDKGGQSYL